MGEWWGVVEGGSGRVMGGWERGAFDAGGGGGGGR